MHTLLNVTKFFDMVKFEEIEAEAELPDTTGGLIETEATP